MVLSHTYGNKNGSLGIARSGESTITEESAWGFTPSYPVYDALDASHILLATATD